MKSITRKSGYFPIIKIIVFLFSGCGISFLSFSQEKPGQLLSRWINEEVRQLMDDGDIPGLSLVMIKDGHLTINSFGYADLEKKQAVSSRTLFELGSCSKAFTALAVMKLCDEGLIDLNAHVSSYLPWFYVKYKDSLVEITLRQVLHHTSGIPWQTISAIPVSNDKDALEQTVRKIIGVNLHQLPGRQYEYATIHYDILALIIEKITHRKFEDYIRENIFEELQLYNTRVGEPIDRDLMSTGYKIGFFKARKYTAPVYKGNNAAGYVISNAEDMARWLQFQMGLSGQKMYELARITQQRDETVPLHDMASYAMGWEVSLNGSGEIYHGGLNPNYTSYIAFRPEKKVGVAVLANSNSGTTRVIGDRVLKLLAGQEVKRKYEQGDSSDKAFSMVSLIIGCYVLVVIAFLIRMILSIIMGKRRYEQLSPARIGKFILSLLILLPFLYGLYIFPKAFADFTWSSIVVWTPVSFTVLMALISAAIALSYMTYFLGLCFPEKNRYKRIIPQVLLISIISGVANMAVIALVTSALDTGIELKYLILYYTLTVLIYLVGRRFVQVNLIKLTRELIYELKIKLIDKIFSTSYQKFENIDRGRVYTTLNDDVDMVGGSTNVIVMLITSVFTTIGAILYLVSIAFWATMLAVLLIVSISITYFLVSKSTTVYFEEARDTRNVFMRFISGLIDGYKEISLRRNKKIEYKAEMSCTANEYKEKIAIANIRFVNAFLVGESLLVLLLGLVVFGIPEVFPDIQSHTVMSFVIILLYLIGPVNGILNAVPTIMQLRIAWDRIRKFLKEVPANLDLGVAPDLIKDKIERIKIEGLRFRYNGGDEPRNFEIGPIDLEVRSGEILFIIGGNGSGKTTLAKLITGLYEPDDGGIMINDKPVKGAQLSEHFSAVFSPSYIFKKLYDVDLKEKSEEVSKYMKILDLEGVVEIKDNEYSRINLSGGQRKRLALLQCYLEDAPIYLFDEWAADQDPEYRKFFYRTLLPEMKRMGKIVIAITHDDHYFDVADAIWKMKQGKLEDYTSEYHIKEAVQ